MTMPAGWKPPSSSTPSSSLYQALGPEQSIWHNEVMTGIIHRKVVETQTITNYRVLRSDCGVFLKDLDDIVIMNQQRISQSQYSGISSGRYSRVGFGNTRSKSITVGDLVFVYQGRPYITFSQISDPYGVARLAKAARKRILQAIKTAEKVESQSLKAREKIRPQIEQQQFSQRSKNTVTLQSQGYLEEKRINSKDASCSQCGSTNPAGSKFCNKCGFRLISMCRRCTNNNPAGSKFCNKCGYDLR